MLPISQRSPTVAPITRQRCPNTVRRPTTVGIAAVPTTTEFSSTAVPVPDRDAQVPGADDSTFGEQHAVADPGAPTTTADDAMLGTGASSASVAVSAGPLLMLGCSVGVAVHSIPVREQRRRGIAAALCGCSVQ